MKVKKYENELVDMIRSMLIELDLTYCYALRKHYNL